MKKGDSKNATGDKQDSLDFHQRLRCNGNLGIIILPLPILTQDDPQAESQIVCAMVRFSCKGLTVPFPKGRTLPRFAILDQRSTGNAYIDSKLENFKRCDLM